MSDIIKKIHEQQAERNRIKYSKTTPMKYYIYVITPIQKKNCDIDMRAYIGITRSWNNRFTEHKKRFIKYFNFNMKPIKVDIMTMYEAEKIETQSINEYISKGYLLFNRAKCPHEYRCEL